MIDIIKYALSNLWQRKLRSALTMLSILIGITAIFALVSFGQGINKYITDFAQEMGTDKIMMTPGGGLSAAPGTSNILFTEDDFEFIKKIKGVSDATAMLITASKVEFKDYKEKYPYVMGLSTDIKEMELVEEMFAGIEIIKGRELKKGDVLKATLGYSYLIENKMFKKPLSVGDTLKIKDIPVKVVGFYEEIGNPGDDSNVYLTLEGYERIFGDSDYEYLYIRSALGEDPAALADKIKERFRKRRDQKKGEEDFTIQTFEDAIASFTSIITILNGVLVLIALISVVVAAVNIMNTMYTSILERTNEIGVMKSIGAQNKYILFVFMFESGLLGLVGGAVGIGLGYLIAKLGGVIAASSGLAMLRPTFSPYLIIGCLLFSLLVGTASGFLPSLRASKLNPVDALRYE